MPESDFKQVGTVEILRSQVYPIDPHHKGLFPTEAIVEPGHYPLLFDGYSHGWVMTGKLGGQLLRRGDGLFIGVTHPEAIPLNIDVTFPSKMFGPDDWKELLAEPVFQEGHPEQRLRITLPKANT